MSHLPFRIGHGYDVHRLVPNRDLILGGVNIPHETGLLGHSDADVLLHAIMDALLGAAGLGGLLIGGLVSAIMLAVFMANAGGAWDNAKKYVESGKFGGKGSDTHKAAITGDTVGDPLKDTAGPAMDILIKLMSVISLILVPVLVELTPLWNIIVEFFAKL